MLDFTAFLIGERCRPGASVIGVALSNKYEVQVEWQSHGNGQDAFGLNAGVDPDAE